MHGGQVVVTPSLDGALALEVYDHGALLGLQRVVSACGHEAFDDVVKRVVVVVEQRQAPLVVKQHIGQDVFLRLDGRGQAGVERDKSGHRL